MLNLIKYTKKQSLKLEFQTILYIKNFNQIMEKNEYFDHLSESCLHFL